MRQTRNTVGGNLLPRKRRAFTPAERIADGIVHGVGLAAAVTAGTALMVSAAVDADRGDVAAVVAYVGSFIVLFSVSMAFNLCPAGTVKAWLARIDQAAIFLFIAATYTPLLSLLGDVPVAGRLMIFVWSAAIVGVALKLLVPRHFGRLAIVFYLSIGWSGILAFNALAEALPATAVWLLVAGGIAYSAGVIFHLWKALHFQNVLWHVFVVIGASLHFIAIFDAMVLSRT